MKLSQIKFVSIEVIKDQWVVDALLDDQRVGSFSDLNRTQVVVKNSPKLRQVFVRESDAKTFAKLLNLIASKSPNLINIDTRVNLGEVADHFEIYVKGEPPSQLGVLAMQAIEHRQIDELPSTLEMYIGLVYAYFRHTYTNYDDVITAIDQINSNSVDDTDQFLAVKDSLQNAAKLLCQKVYGEDGFWKKAKNELRTLQATRTLFDLRTHKIVFPSTAATAMGIDPSPGISKGGKIVHSLKKVYKSEASLLEVRRDVRWFRFWDWDNLTWEELPSLSKLPENYTVSVYSLEEELVSRVTTGGAERLLDNGEAVWDNEKLVFIKLFPDEWRQSLD